MKKINLVKILVTFALFTSLFYFSYSQEIVNEKIKLSLQSVKLAQDLIQKGVNFLTDNQKPDGSWCEHPGITGLVCIALHNSNTTNNLELKENAIKKGRKYMLYFVQKDGSIWMSGKEREFPVYTTSIVLAALATLNNPDDIEVMKNARKFLLNCQLTQNNPEYPTPEDSDSFGGFSYGLDGPLRADLSNTQWVLEALYMTEYLDKEPYSNDPELQKKSKLAWNNAVKFVSRLQNLPESNDQAWIVKDPNDPQRGGFVYVSPERMKGNKKSLRTYGSMTYAGLKSMIYAQVKKDDPRVKAAIEWAAKNYTLDENPGMGEEGHYYYLHTFAKAHSVYGEDVIITSDGKLRNWREDIIKKLSELQRENGSWYNQNGRWMESVPELVTAYSLIALELALNKK